MWSRRWRIYGWSIGGMLVLFASTFGWWLSSTDVWSVISCATDGRSWAKPFCRATVTYFRPTTTDTASLKNDHGWPYQLLAIRDPHLRQQLFERFIAKGLNLNVPSPADSTLMGVEGKTVLFSAASDGDVEGVKLLLALGADKRHRSAIGRLPVDYAISMKRKTGDPKYDEVIRLLQ
ncbi:hypothetical protein HNQ59_002596 [Chitinivorax tropicus]|uniref:Ankyrin repeat domain-containing protein n=1 Tax=Chitinivorax tropicus TaxID=714531 RepID=A0A840MKX0_9PROT|nr:ankyrin repeat domain-containing protein [Chitinivorax tropicus]MBB5019298.1 hypothetical protein [Chitinivorax tropicus]